MLRITLGVSFFLYGFGKFPLPSELLLSFGFSQFVAVLVPLVEVIGGIGIILTGFISGLWGQLLTRALGLVLCVNDFCSSTCAFDWLINAELFKNNSLLYLYTLFLNQKVK